jgi:peptidoglycan/xylan/chitin deacetylase (PgdA/CDA1 family)
MIPGELASLALGGAALLVGAAGAYFSPHAHKAVQIRRLRVACRRQRVLVLTYDDGPGAALTPRLLALLAAERARATFFPLGQCAAARPDLLDAVRAGEHEIGCHGMWHRHSWRTTPGAALADIRAGFSALARWTPSDGLFRPPCGKLTLPTAWHVWRRGAALAWWTIDSGDTHDEMPGSETIEEQLARAGGGVVLLHDFDRQRPDADARHAFVLDTTARLLRRARSEGLSVRRLGEVRRSAAPAPVETLLTARKPG